MLIEFENGAIYRLAHLVQAREGVFFDSLENEGTPLGKCFVDSIWYKRPIRLIDSNRLVAAHGEIWRCHIAGPVFANMLQAARSQNPASDVAAVWEIRTDGWSAVSQDELKDLTERSVSPGKADAPEFHLDHPVICHTDLLTD